MQGMWRYLWRGMPVWGTDGGAEGFSQSHIRGISSQTSEIIRIWGRVILSRTGYLFTRLFEMLWFWNRLGQTHMILYWKSREFWHTAIRCFRVLRTAGRRTCFFRCSDKGADSSSVPGRKGRTPWIHTVLPVHRRCGHPHGAQHRESGRFYILESSAHPALGRFIDVFFTCTLSGWSATFLEISAWPEGRGIWSTLSESSMNTG